MRITTILFIAAVVQVSANGFAQKITLNKQNIPVAELLIEITRQTGYNVIYPDSRLDQNRRLNANFNGTHLNEVLAKAFSGSNYSFLIEDKNIVIKERLSSNSSAMQTTIRGIVTDSKGSPIAGVNIKVKESPQIGTSTDASGRYSLVLPPASATLAFSYIGFKSLEVPISGRTSIDVSLEDDATGLNEIIITGYTSTARKDLTGAVGVVNIEDIQKAPVRSFEEALAGRVAGVQVVSEDGRPGSPINILIRGVGSISQSSSPLFVIDGLAIEDPDNNMIDPDDIESMTVLKDASSTAIYGSRGSNGVIVITTKRGKKGKAVVSYNSNYGFNQPMRYMKVLSPYEFVKVISEQLGASANPYLTDNMTLENYRNVKGIDWQGQLMRTGYQQNQSLSIRGGTDQTKYSLSGNFMDQKGIMIKSGYTRFQGKLTIDQDLGKSVKAGGFITKTVGNTEGRTPSGKSQASLLYQAYTYRPIPIPGVGLEAFEDELYDPSNGLADYRVNPFISLQNEHRFNVSDNLLANVYLNINILKNLKLSLQGSLNSHDTRREIFNNSKTRAGGPNGTTGVNGSILYGERDILDNTNTLEYSTTINKVHKLNILAGGSIQKTDTRSYGYDSSFIPDESQGMSGIDAGIIGLTPTAGISESGLLSGFGSINYIYNNKYYLTTNFRADASSKFREKNRWGYFPSLALKWKISEEPFFKRIPFLSDGNIRFSYGETGNNRIGDFESYARMTFDRPLYLFGVSQGNSMVTTRMSNPDLKWETAKSTDLGFDFGFFKNKVNLTVDLYKKSTNDLLFSAKLPGSTGYATATKNIASMTNRGVEFTLSTEVVNTSNFSYSNSFNITFNRNRLDALSDPTEEALTTIVDWEALYGNGSAPAYIAKIGGPLGQVYGLISDGVYQYSDFDRLPNGTYVLKGNLPSNALTANRGNVQPGSAKFVDLNNDGQITEADRTVIGNGYPLHTGGFSNNLKYKNFDANIFFQWSYGNDVINATRLWFEPGQGIQTRSSNFGGQNTFAEFANRWTPANQNTDIPALNRGKTGEYTSQYVEDGSYFRLKTLNVGYSFPKKLLSRYKISKVRVYVATTNIFTITKYTGFDPEVSAFQSGLSPSLDYSSYPRPFTVTGGLNISL